MDFRSKSHFEFLGLAESYRLDPAQLQQAYLRLQGAVHPDRFARAGGAEHRIAMQLATQANEANRTLSDPTRRAAYLCELHGAPIQAETNTSMAHSFLVEQMGWRESLEAARDTKDGVALAGLDRLLCDHRTRLHDEIAQAIDLDHDYPRAADAVRRLMFIDKFGAEVAAAQDALAA